MEKIKTKASSHLNACYVNKHLQKVCVFDTLCKNCSINFILHTMEDHTHIYIRTYFTISQVFFKFFPLQREA